MFAVLRQFRRYICWAAFGAAVFGTPFLLLLLPYNSISEALPLPTIIACFGGILSVVTRAVVGLATALRPDAADRMTALLVARFSFGWILGICVLFLLVNTGRGIPFAWQETHRFFSQPSVLLQYAFSGGVSLLVTGRLSRWRHGRWMLPVAWILLLFVLVYTWFALREQVPYEVHRFFRRLND